MILSTEIELNENNCEENTFTVSVEKHLNNWLFCAKENCENGRSFYYELLEDFEKLKNNSITRYEILSYSLGSFTNEDEVTFKDIFLHSKHIKRLI